MMYIYILSMFLYVSWKNFHMRKLWDVRAAFDIKRLFLHAVFMNI